MDAARTRWVFFATVTAFAAIGAGPDGRPLVDGAGEVIASFPCSPRKGLILVPVTLGDRCYDFVVDTGAERTVFDRRLRTMLGAPLGDVVVNGSLKAEKFPWPTARLGTMVLASDKPVVCLDLTDVREMTGQELFGIIGMDWLEKMTFRVDPDREQISFLRTDRQPPPLLSRGIPIEIDGGRPRIEVEVAGLGRVKFLLDTGYLGAGRLLPADLPGQGSSLKVLWTSRGAYGDLQGLHWADIAAIESLTIGEDRHEGPVLSQRRSGSDRLLGLEILSRHVATLDMPQRMLRLERAGAFGTPWIFDQSGAVLIRRRGETIVESLDAKGPAAKAGIRAGDILLRVGEKPASDLSLWEIERIFTSLGTTHRLTLSRDSGAFEATMVLREW